MQLQNPFIWNQTPRTLTSALPSLTVVGAASVVTNGSILDLRPTGFKVRTGYLADGTATTNMFMGTYDGVTFGSNLTIAAGFNRTFVAAFALGMGIKNSTGSSQTVYWNAYDIL